MPTWRKIVLACFVPALGLLAFAGWTLMQAQLGRPLSLPAIWMSNLLGTLSTFFGMGWTVGGAYVVVQVFGTILMLVAIGVFIIPPFIGAFFDLPSRQEFRDFAERNFTPPDGWTWSKLLLLAAIILCVIALGGMCYVIWHGILTTGQVTVPAMAPWIILFVPSTLLLLGALGIDSRNDSALNGNS